MINKIVQLKTQPEYIGRIKKLHLSKDEEKYRKNDLWLISWDNGKMGIVELKELKIL